MHKLKSNRLIFRNFKSDDLIYIKELYQSKEVMQFISNGEPYSDEKCREQLEKFLENQSEQLPLGQWLAFTQESNEFVGIFLFKMFPGIREPGIGYSITPTQWNKGYAFEGANRLCEYIQNQTKYKVISAITSPEHFISQKVLIKLGFELKENIQYASPMTNQMETVSCFVKQLS